MHLLTAPWRRALVRERERPLDCGAFPSPALRFLPLTRVHPNHLPLVSLVTRPLKHRGDSLHLHPFQLQLVLLLSPNRSMLLVASSPGHTSCSTTTASALHPVPDPLHHLTSTPRAPIRVQVQEEGEVPVAMEQVRPDPTTRPMVSSTAMEYLQDPLGTL